MPKSRHGLSPKQEIFIAEYLKTLNATSAAIKAGYPKGTARVIGGQNLIKLDAQIEKAKQKRLERTRIDADALLVHLTEAVFSDMSDIRNDDGSYKPISEWPVIWRQMCTGGDTEVEDIFGRSQDGVQKGKSKAWDKRGTVTREKYRFPDKAKMIELAMRHSQVNALALPKEENHLHLHVHQQVEERLARARLVAAGIEPEK